MRTLTRLLPMSAVNDVDAPAVHDRHKAYLFLRIPHSW